ncbi:MAG TPA: hypothetical protein VF407_15940, partial [Polyangiaceae bacterium]
MITRKRTTLVGALVLGASALGCQAILGIDDTTFSPDAGDDGGASDSGHDDGAISDGGSTDSGSDAHVDVDAGNALVSI